MHIWSEVFHGERALDSQLYITAHDQSLCKLYKSKNYAGLSRQAAAPVAFMLVVLAESSAGCPYFMVNGACGPPRFVRDLNHSEVLLWSVRLHYLNLLFIILISCSLLAYSHLIVVFLR